MKGNSMKKALLALAAATAAVQAWAISGTISTATDTKKGDIKWQSRNKLYTIKIKKGTMMVDMELKLADVVSLDIPKPESFDRAVAQVESGNGAAAVAALTKIVEDYRMLVWDKPAGRYLALAHLAAGNAQKAYDVCQKIINEDKSAAYMGDVAPAYWQVLLKLGKVDQLEGLLKKAASSDDRVASAAALVMRGDIIMNGANDDPAKLRTALRDGYLRVVMMYRDHACRRERTEALLKAADVFDKLHQSSRAETFRREAKMSAM